MKKILLSISLLTTLNSFSQSKDEFCGTTDSYLQILEANPEIRTLREASDKEAMEIDQLLYQNKYKKGTPTNNLKANNVMNSQGIIYTIPVVFHILHLGGSENISDAQVMSCIGEMNKDFESTTADTANTQTPFMGLEANCEISFALATKDPNGNCTNGIVHHYDTNTDWSKGNTPFDYTWNTSKYYNVYVVRSFDTGIGGYSSFPGTNSINSGKDVTVILSTYVGNIGTSSQSRSHIMAHETGHWLNLYHIWDCCTAVETNCGTDQVSDTPKTQGYTNCPSGSGNQICTNGVSENPNNFMDYSYCYTMFTAGQATRMRNTLINNTGNVGRSTLHSATNLINTGVTNPQVCVPTPDFNYNKEYVCQNNTVTFSDNSENAQTTSWAWDFPGGTPSSSIDSIPVITYSTPGIYPVSYTAATTAGGAGITKNSLINVGTSTATVQSSLIEGFESITVPNSDWTIDNTSGGVSWVQDTTLGATGTNCMKIDNFTNIDSVVEILYTPSYNIQAIAAASPNPTFTFKLAYQRKTTAASEKLQVFSSTNCGQTWSQRYSKTGAGLATVTAANTSAFVPAAGNWRTETVSISALIAQQNVWFKFVFTSDVNGAKNNIYIDDINISNNGVGLKDVFESSLAYNVYPNPNNGNMNVSFSLTEKRKVKLELIDVLGRTLEVASNSLLQAGNHSFEFGVGGKLATGIYFSKLTIDGKIYSQKIIVE